MKTKSLFLQQLIKWFLANNVKIGLMDFASRILSWYEKNKRDLPWRMSKDPYVIWVSEVILQQTRMNQGLVFFGRFVTAFPDIYSLASAKEDKVLRTWQGFGYYTRARNMHATAREIVSRYGGNFPSSYKDLLRLKGVGPYTAAAIASIAFGEVVPAVDGNVNRIYARLFALPEKIDTTIGKKRIAHISSSLISGQYPGEYNQALMDFGSLVCKPQNPDCANCLFNRECLAFLQNAVGTYPLRSPRRKPVTRYFSYFLFLNRTAQGEVLFYVKQRTGSDIWKNLYDLPVMETAGSVVPEEISATPWWKSLFPGIDDLHICGEIVQLHHQLTHQSIKAVFFCVDATEAMCRMLRNDHVEVSVSVFEDMPKPILLKNYLEKFACAELLTPAASKKH